MKIFLSFIICFVYVNNATCIIINGKDSYGSVTPRCGLSFYLLHIRAYKNLHGLKIYPMNVGKDSNCLIHLTEYNVDRNIELPFNTCNTIKNNDENGSTFTNTLIIQPDDALNSTRNLRKLNLKCFYYEPKKECKAASPPRKTFIQNFYPLVKKVPMYPVDTEMKITSDFEGSKTLLRAKAGDSAYLSVRLLNNPRNYTLWVTDCTALNKADDKSEINIFSKGCPTHSSMAEFIYSEDGQKATAKIKSMIANTTGFNCSINLCPEYFMCTDVPECNTTQEERYNSRKEKNLKSEDPPQGVEQNSTIKYHESKDSPQKKKSTHPQIGGLRINSPEVLAIKLLSQPIYVVPDNK